MKIKNKIKNVVNLINEEYEDELSHLNIDFSIEFNCYEGFVDIDISTLCNKGDFLETILLLIFIALKFIYYR